MHNFLLIVYNAEFGIALIDWHINIVYNNPMTGTLKKYL